MNRTQPDRPDGPGRRQVAIRSAVVFVVASVLLVGVAATAGAHVQVTPTEAAPLDPVQWTVLVPNERDSSTVKVELQVPEGMLPFSYGDTPGWDRALTMADDQSVETIVWEGRLERDGFVEFTFLATTPDQEGQIEWKSLQTYDDGTVVEWIGDPESEEPAAITTVSADAPRQGAGGEGGSESPPAGGEEGDEPEPEAEPEEAESDGSVAAPGDDAEDSDEGTSMVSVAALVASLAALVLALFAYLGSRRSGRRTA